MIQPPSVLLMGPSGSGKTYSLSTLLESGLEVFLVVTEPHGLETLLDVVAQKKLDINKLHWRYIPPARPGFETPRAYALSRFQGTNPPAAAAVNRRVMW